MSYKPFNRALKKELPLEETRIERGTVRAWQGYKLNVNDDASDASDAISTKDEKTENGNFRESRKPVTSVTSVNAVTKGNDPKDQIDRYFEDERNVVEG